MEDGRLNRDLLWIEPYGSLRVFVRVWYDQLKSLHGLRRYNDSDILRKVGERNAQAIAAIAAFHEELKTDAEKHIAEIVKETVEWNTWGKFVPGLGAHSLGKLLGLVGNPAARTYVSSLWRHCGLGVVNGKLEKPVKGEPLHYNTKAKSQVYLIASSFLKAYSRTPNFYGEVYYEYRQRFAEKHPDWTPMHCHLAALLKVGKFFLSHLHQISRMAQGLPVAPPYPIQHQGHLVYYSPQIALHPRKRRSEVEAAIAEVERLLPAEPDEDVRDLHSRLITRLKAGIESR